MLQGEPDRAQSILRLTDGDGGSAAAGDDCQRHPRYVGKLIVTPGHILAIGVWVLFEINKIK